MKFINFRVIEFSIAVSAGIICAHQEWITFSLWPLLLVFILISLGIWIWNGKHLSPSRWSPLVSFICFFLIGFINYQAGLPEFQHHFSKESNYSSPKFRVLQITEVLKPSMYYDTYEAKCIPSDYDDRVGNVLLRIENSNCLPELGPDDRIIFYGKITPIASPKNPNPFDYKKYMSHNGIYHQITLTQNSIVELKKETHTLRGKAHKIRDFLIKKLDQTTIGTQEKSIIHALILGDKKSIDRELYKSYAAAGAVHILAVSGLHVGILLWLLNFLFKPMDSLPKGKWVKLILLLVFLWTFAFIAGLSPSVVRAVTMFSMFAVAEFSNRLTNSINTLFLSYFLLLLIQPNWLFQVGFQLSYLAVASILWLQPKLTRLWQPKNWFIKRGWDIMAVTIAAQIGVAPLSIYYFHQFPGMFLFTNLVILPFLAFLLTYGLVVVLLAAFEILPDILAKAYHFLIEGLNFFMKWSAAQNTFLFENLSLSGWSMVFIYILMITFLLVIYTRSKVWVYTFLTIFVLFLGQSFYRRVTEENEWILFHLYGKNLMAHKSKEEISIYSNRSQPDANELYILNTYSQLKGKPLTRIKARPDVFKLNQDSLLILDSLGVYPKLPQAVIILTYNSKVHLERLIETIHPKLIIADGSNYPMNVRRWKRTCATKQIPFYATQEQGAFQLNLKKKY